jgi:ribosome recycling factor
MEMRTHILRDLNKTIEGAKNQVRTARADGLKLMGGKTAQGAEDVQDLANDFGKQLDDLLAQAKKELEK